MSDLSAYIHIPFCRRKCNYCDFYSAPPIHGAVSSYARALASQIRNSAAAGEMLRTVYIGGGTPSLLSEEDFASLAEALQDTFDLSSCEEFTVECNPESVTPSLGATWRSFGVNRVSMGVQTFCDRQLRNLGRLHSADDAENAYYTLRKSGFDNISLDLMAALPDQTEEAFSLDLRNMLRLSPEHLSVYLLKIEPNSPFGKEGVAEADEEVQRAFYLMAHRMLTEGGYEHYEISNFARPGFRARHNSAYWQGKEYLAFGPGASGFFRGVRYRVPADTSLFCLQNGAVDPEIEEVVDEEEAKREGVMLGLRLSDGIDVSLIPQEKKSLVRTLCNQGLGVLTEDRFSLTAEGFLISDYVISELMPDR